MAIKTWVGKAHTGKRFRTRSEASKHLFLGEYPLRVKFRFEIAWIVVELDIITTVTTPDGRQLIGYNDPYMAAHNKDTADFCMALCERQIS